MTARFQHRVALITGGSSGIGRATALAFAREGATVVIAARSPKAGAEVLREITASVNTPVRFIPTDVTSAADCQALVSSLMDSFGRLDVLVNNASYLGVVGGRGVAAYSAAKGAVVNLTRAMALGHAGDGIRVNCVAPGSVETPMLRQEWEEMGGEALVRHLFEEKHPMGRISQPEEIARVILFLASPEASFINGACIPVDAGITAG